MKRFNVNQIVKGVSAGTFAVLGYRKIAGVEYVQLKEFAVGELALPEDCLMEIV